MKKSINFVLIITIILLICPSVYAKPITKDRNSSENYGVNKKWNITDNNINNITVVRMGVPCCGGIEMAIKRAIKNSQKNISLDIITISTSGEIL